MDVRALLESYLRSLVNVELNDPNLSKQHAVEGLLNKGGGADYLKQLVSFYYHSFQAEYMQASKLLTLLQTPSQSWLKVIEFHSPGVIQKLMQSIAIFNKDFTHKVSAIVNQMIQTRQRREVQANYNQCIEDMKDTVTIFLSAHLSSLIQKSSPKSKKKGSSQVESAKQLNSLIGNGESAQAGSLCKKLDSGKYSLKSIDEEAASIDTTITLETQLKDINNALREMFTAIDTSYRRVSKMNVTRYSDKVAVINEAVQKASRNKALQKMLMKSFIGIAVLFALMFGSLAVLVYQSILPIATLKMCMIPAVSILLVASVLTAYKLRSIETDITSSISPVLSNHIQMFPLAQGSQIPVMNVSDALGITIALQ